MTQSNAVIRKLNDKAVILIVTEWDEFECLMKHAKSDNPTMQVGCLTKTDFSSGMIPCTIFNTNAPKDITKETEGQTIDGIAKGEWWVTKKVNNPLSQLYGGM